MKVECPKCGSNSAWYIRSSNDIALKCLCGYYKVTYSVLETVVIEHKETEVKIPKKDSNLWVTLMSLAGLKSATTAQIKTKLDEIGKQFTMSDVASYLTFLRTKGLVETTEIRRGIAGGSTWVLTDDCAELLGVEYYGTIDRV